MKITIIGAGNVGFNLACELYSKKHSIIQVYSRSLKNAMQLANIVNAKFTDNIKEINESADLYIISVNDASIPRVIDNLKVSEGIFVHTSGSTDMNVLNSRFNDVGVFYPLQSFSKSKLISFIDVPICIESRNKKTEIILENLACDISEKVVIVNSNERKKIHLAAVFACNFVNYLFRISKELMESNKLDWNLLFPLINETVQKALTLDPEKTQTGPAIRGDLEIIKSHKKMLSTNDALKKIYEIFTSQIVENNKKNIN